MFFSCFLVPLFPFPFHLFLFSLPVPVCLTSLFFLYFLFLFVSGSKGEGGKLACCVFFSLVFSLSFLPFPLSFPFPLFCLSFPYLCRFLFYSLVPVYFLSCPFVFAFSVPIRYPFSFSFSPPFPFTLVLVLLRVAKGEGWNLNIFFGLYLSPPFLRFLFPLSSFPLQLSLAFLLSLVSLYLPYFPSISVFYCSLSCPFFSFFPLPFFPSPF